MPRLAETYGQSEELEEQVTVAVIPLFGNFPIRLSDSILRFAMFSMLFFRSLPFIDISRNTSRQYGI